jgi:hypothetical protein
MNALRNVWIAMRTTPSALWWIASGVLAFLFAKIYIFDYIPEAFPKAIEVGRLAQNLGEATLAALIFFIFSYQLPSVVEQKRVGRTLIRLLESVVSLVTQPIERVYAVIERPDLGQLDFASVTETMILSYFERVDCATISDWLTSLTESDQKCREIINQLWRYSRFVDSEIFGLLSELELSEYSAVLPRFRELLPHGRHPTLAPLATPYFWNFNVAMRLAKAAKTLQKRYGILTT